MIMHLKLKYFKIIKNISHEVFYGSSRTLLNLKKTRNQKNLPNNKFTTKFENEICTKNEKLTTKFLRKMFQKLIFSVIN